MIHKMVVNTSRKSAKTTRGIKKSSPKRKSSASKKSNLKVAGKKKKKTKGKRASNKSKPPTSRKMNKKSKSPINNGKGIYNRKVESISKDQSAYSYFIKRSRETKFETCKSIEEGKSFYQAPSILKAGASGSNRKRDMSETEREAVIRGLSPHDNSNKKDERYISKNYQSPFERSILSQNPMAALDSNSKSYQIVSKIMN